MFSRLLNRDPHTRKRALALTVDFLKQHKDRIFIETFARHTGANKKARGVDAALDGYGPHAQAQIGHYPEYAVHLARYAVIACSPILAEPIDDRKIYLDTAMALYRTLDLSPESAADTVMEIIEATPENEWPDRLTEEQVAALPEAVRRIVRLQNIARRDSLRVMEAFADGLRKIDLSDYDIDPVADLLDLSFIPDPDHERLAARLKSVQD